MAMATPSLEKVSIPVVISTRHNINKKTMDISGKARSAIGTPILPLSQEIQALKVGRKWLKK